MLELNRIYLSIGLLLALLTLTFHLIAMGYPRWKIYEHRRNPSETILVGLYHRCENQLITILDDTTKIYPICDENRYLSYRANLTTIVNRLQPQEAARLCNIAGNPYRCAYTRVNQFLVSSTIISASTISLAVLLMYSHLLINQFKYKTHFFIAIVTVGLLALAFLFLLLTLIVVGSTMANDLFEYRFNLNYRLKEQKRRNLTTNLEQTVRQSAASDYDIRLDWSAGLEIISLVLSSFTLVTQILYLFSTYRNRIG